MLAKRKSCGFSCELLLHKVQNVVFLFTQAKLKWTTILFFYRFSFSIPMVKTHEGKEGER